MAGQRDATDDRALRHDGPAPGPAAAFATSCRCSRPRSLGLVAAASVRRLFPPAISSPPSTRCSTRTMPYGAASSCSRQQRPQNDPVSSRPRRFHPLGATWCDPGVRVGVGVRTAGAGPGPRATGSDLIMAMGHGSCIARQDRRAGDARGSRPLGRPRRGRVTLMSTTERHGRRSHRRGCRLDLFDIWKGNVSRRRKRGERPFMCGLGGSSHSRVV